MSQTVRVCNMVTIVAMMTFVIVNDNYELN